MSGILDGTMTFNGTVRVADGAISNSQISSAADIERSKLKQDALAKYIFPITQLRVWDNMASLLPNPSVADDIGIAAASFGTNSPYLDTRDLKTLTTSLYARGIWALPPEYDDGQTVLMRIRASADTTVASSSLNLDLVLYEMNRDGGIGTDLCATAAQSINNLTLADKDFTITATNLVRGDQLDFRIEIAVVDSATATAVKAKITEVAVLIDIRG